MGRPNLVTDADLMDNLSRVFRKFGFDGASLTQLSEATGLKKASLYHRFPDGKEQMASEVLAAAAEWLGTNVVAPLESDDPPHERVKLVVRRLDKFYSGGRQACLLNLLSSVHIHEGRFQQEVQAIFKGFVAGLKRVAMDAGFDAKVARARAERAVMLLQGSLVLSRGLGTTRPFRDCLRTLPDEILGPH